MKCILVIDDDINIGNMLEEALRLEGYKVKRAYSGSEALMVLEKLTPDLILLDLMLPGLSGEEVLPKIKGIPVIIMSAKSETEHKVNLLYEGASDYITKPFVLSELLARVASILRLAGNAPQAELEVEENYNITTAGDVELDTELLVARIGDGEVSLTRTESAILNILMLNDGRPVGRNTILDRISNDTPDCTERSLKQHVSNIRKKLETLDGKDHIEAIYGIGFRFVS
ncbi:DNA-binding response regulator, OmpR family, contains REC and winged-helix (wHTH) domain [Lachnospiraceae bacterium NE2001]|nr:DNA-binding response regulator, OmpR family, contains REC and winged-helix (wHTH) domain [Lachnospiraceae bacterium NE2001]